MHFDTYTITVGTSAPRVDWILVIFLVKYYLVDLQRIYTDRITPYQV